ncbi:MAG: hypothetical protein GTO63_03325 [Anaerolineae bacterium]|nr:hypothetical protein [Anaerolineae bacterium]NIN94043.1 hypothetical protein [Anaerolineae bacterium]NIQ77084.1 hypothetical protein [Anaerolineae bacterium]
MASESHVERLLTEGIAAVKAGRSQDALELLSEVVALEPENEKAWLWMSAVLPDQGRIECLKRVVEINPRNELAWKGLELLLADAAPAHEPVPAVSVPEASPESRSPGLEERTAVEADGGARGIGRSCALYTGITALAGITLSVCVVALMLGGTMLIPASPQVGPAAMMPHLPTETTTTVPESAVPPTVTPTATKTPVPTNTLVVPDARIPGFPIINEGAYDEIETRVSELRALQPLRETQRQTFTRYRLEEYLMDVYRRDAYLEEMEIAERMYRVLGLIDEGYELAENQVEIQREYLAGLYDTETEDIYLILDRYTSDLWLEVTFAHEFTHALQDQHFDLDSLQGRARTTDSLLALQALIEGDATLVMIEYAFQHLFQMQFERIDLLKAIQEVEQGEYEEAPGVIRETAWFPYDQGLVFVAALVEQGGWDRLNEAFRHPPQSTEQIMHPDKYLAGEVGRIPEVGDLPGAVGAGWLELRRDTFGELFIRVYLERELSSEEALMAAEGWAGDRVVFLTSEDRGRYLLIVRTSWDTTDEAQEFFSAYATFMQRSGAGRSLVQDTERKQWRTELQVTYLGRQGQEVLLALASDEEALDLALTEFSTF